MATPTLSPYIMIMDDFTSWPAKQFNIVPHRDFLKELEVRCAKYTKRLYLKKREYVHLRNLCGTPTLKGSKRSNRGRSLGVEQARHYIGVARAYLEKTAAQQITAKLTEDKRREEARKHAEMWPFNPILSPYNVVKISNL